MQFIHLVQGAYSKESCANLIHYLETNISSVNPGKAGSTELDCSTLHMDIDFGNPNPNTFGLENALDYALYEYKNKFPLTDSNIGRWHVTPTCNLTKYKPNNYYKYVHCDTGKTTRKRILVWTIYLNNIKEGGGTHFIHQNFTTEPVAGNLYIFPAGWTHMHVGVNAPNETKYLLTGWVEADDI